MSGLISLTILSVSLTKSLDLVLVLNVLESLQMLTDFKVLSLNSKSAHLVVSLLLLILLLVKTILFVLIVLMILDL